MKAMYKDRDVGFYGWPDVAMDGISVNTQREKEYCVSWAHGV